MNVVQAMLVAAAIACYSIAGIGLHVLAKQHRTRIERHNKLRLDGIDGLKIRKRIALPRKHDIPW